MSKWYGNGGLWTNIGLPQDIAIDGKPENGCGMQNSACGRSKIMLRFKLVETAEGEDAMTTLDSDGVRHGALVLRQPVEPRKRSARVVCSDSYFASVFVTEYLRSISLRFIGVRKTGTRRYSMKALAAIQLQKRGGRNGVVCLDEEKFPKLLDFV